MYAPDNKAAKYVNTDRTKRRNKHSKISLSLSPVGISTKQKISKCIDVLNNPINQQNIINV